MATTRPHTPACPLKLTPECPWRPPDWRWRRANWRFASGSRRGERHDDDWIRRAMRYFTTFRREACGRRPYRPEPDLPHAWHLAWFRDWRRAELEARVLADQSIGEISSTMGVPFGVISAFEALFFDVRPRLEESSWIIYEVIGLRPEGPLQPQDVLAAWKYLGFLHGAPTLDALIAAADRTELEKIGLPAYWAPESRLPKDLQFLLLTRSLPETGCRAMKSLDRLAGLGFCEPQAPSVEAPPASLALDLGSDIESILAAWDEQPGTQRGASDSWVARVA